MGLSHGIYQYKIWSKAIITLWEMGVGYKLPLTYNVIKTTLKSTNHEAGKKQFLN